MPMSVGVSAAWKSVTGLHVGVSGVWKGITAGHVGVSSAWKLFHPGLPANLLGFFTGSPGTGWTLCDGGSSTPNLNGYFPKGYTAQGTPGGTNTHTHGSYSGSSGTTLPSQTFNDTSEDNLEAPHTHTINHSHGSGTHTPSYYDLLPYVLAGAESIPTSFVGFFDSSIPSGWSAYTSPYARFIRGNTSTAGGTGGATTHSHSAYSGSSGSAGTAVGATGAVGGGMAKTVASHTHTIDHTHTAISNNPPWIQLIPATPSGALETLPSGIICFFLGSTVPAGWSVYSYAQNKFIKLNSTADTTGGGSSAHTDPYSGNSGATTGTGRPAGSYNISYRDHYHSIAHTHDSQTLEPQNCQLLICKKD